MNILITGSAGFIGFHLTKFLLNNGYRVYSLDNINEYYSSKLKFDRLKDLGIDTNQIQYNVPIISGNHTFIKLDLEDQNNLSTLFKSNNFDLVINLAAQAGVRYSLENPQSYINSNIVGFTNVLECCRNNSVQSLIYASSSSVYGLNTKMPFSTTDNTDFPISLYAATKKSNELLAYTYSHLFEIQTVGLRFFTVYGPWGRPDMAYFSFTKNIIESKPIKIFNNGNLSRDFTYIDDIVKGLFNIIKQPQKSRYELYNIGNNKPVRLMDFIETLENVIGKKSIKEFVEMQKGDVITTYADVDKLIEDYNYKPNTTIHEGLTEFYDWYKKYFKV